MTEQIKCDNCGRTGEYPYPGDWRMARYQGYVPTHGSDTRDKHFCSSPCIHEYYRERVEMPTR